jgi:hypothetical protein
VWAGILTGFRWVGEDEAINWYQVLGGASFFCVNSRIMGITEPASPTLTLGKKLAGLRWNSLTNGGRFLRSDPLLFCVVNVKEVIDVVP